MWLPRLRWGGRLRPLDASALSLLCWLQGAVLLLLLLACSELRCDCRSHRRSRTFSAALPSSAFFSVSRFSASALPFEYLQPHTGGGRAPEGLSAPHAPVAWDGDRGRRPSRSCLWGRRGVAGRREPRGAAGGDLRLPGCQSVFSRATLTALERGTAKGESWGDCSGLIASFPSPLPFFFLAPRTLSHSSHAVSPVCVSPPVPLSRPPPSFARAYLSPLGARGGLSCAPSASCASGLPGPPRCMYSPRETLACLASLSQRMLRALRVPKRAAATEEAQGAVSAQPAVATPAQGEVRNGAQGEVRNGAPGEALQRTDVAQAARGGRGAADGQEVDEGTFSGSGQEAAPHRYRGCSVRPKQRRDAKKAPAPFSSTVLLPATKFKLKSRNLKTELAIQRLWRRADTYQRLLRRLFLRQTNAAGAAAPAPRQRAPGASPEGPEAPCRCAFCELLAFEETHQPSPLLPPGDAPAPSQGEGEAASSPSPSASPLYLLLDGPPYANGQTHMGHALNKTLKDFITRFFLLRQRCIHMLPGWDCHGLPIELKAAERLQQETGRSEEDSARERRADASVAEGQVAASSGEQTQAKQRAERSDGACSEAPECSNSGAACEDGSASRPPPRTVRKRESSGRERKGDAPRDAEPETSRSSVIQMRRAARQVAEESIQIQKEDFQRFGVWGHWETPYLTLDRGYEATELEIFRRMWEKGLIYEGVRPVHWSPSSRTALADAEVEYLPRVARSIYCAFPLDLPPREAEGPDSKETRREKNASSLPQAAQGAAAAGGELGTTWRSAPEERRALETFLQSAFPSFAPNREGNARHGGDTHRAAREASAVERTPASAASPAACVDASASQLRLSLLVWTTTPYTLPSNHAVAVHGEKPYALVEVLRGARAAAARAPRDGGSPCSLSALDVAPRALVPAADARGDGARDSPAAAGGQQDAMSSFPSHPLAPVAPASSLSSETSRGATREAALLRRAGEAGGEKGFEAREQREPAPASGALREVWIVAQEAVERTMEILCITPADQDGGLSCLQILDKSQATEEAPEAREREASATSSRDSASGNEPSAPQAFYSVLGTVSGKDLVGKRYKHPMLANEMRRVVSGDALVREQKGTGLVHVSPGHGFEDFMLVQSLRDSDSAEPPSAKATEARERDRENEDTHLPGDGAVGGGDDGEKVELRRSRTRTWSPVDEAGLFTRDVGVPNLAGCSVFGDGEAEILRRLAREGTLVKEVPFPHLYPHDWRTKQPLICRATSQIFLRLERLRALALRAIEQVHFLPQSSQVVAADASGPAGNVRASAHARLRATLAGRRGDWCLSRQRQWGLPLPFFRVEGSDWGLTRSQPAEAAPLFGDADTFAWIAEKIRAEGSDAWWLNNAAADWLPEKQRAHARGLRLGSDTFDVWFDAGCAWRAARDFVRRWAAAAKGRTCLPAVPSGNVATQEEARKRHEPPQGGLGGASVAQADGRDGLNIKTLVLEGTDQHRGWFQALLLTHAALHASAGENPENGSVASEDGSPATDGARASAASWSQQRDCARSNRAAKDGREAGREDGGPSTADARGEDAPRAATETTKKESEEATLPTNVRCKGATESAAATAEPQSAARPFDVLVTHGFVLDAQGRKMSKSLGNVFSPRRFFPPSAPASSARCGSFLQTPLNLPYHGADVLRLFVAASNYGRDLLLQVPAERRSPASPLSPSAGCRCLSEASSRAKEAPGHAATLHRGGEKAGKPGAGTPLDQAAAAYGKLRGMFRFLLGNLQDFDPQRDAIAYERLPFLDRGLLQRLERLLQQTTQAYEVFDFARALRGVLCFLADPFSSFYLEVAKDRLYVAARESRRRRSCQTVLAAVFLTVVKLVAPLAPHVCEEAFLRLPRALRRHMHHRARKHSLNRDSRGAATHASSATGGQPRDAAAQNVAGEGGTPGEEDGGSQPPGGDAEGEAFVSLFESGWPRLRLPRTPRSAARHEGRSPSGVSAANSPAASAADSRDVDAKTDASESRFRAERPGVEAEDEDALWEMLARLRADSNRLLELLPRAKQTKAENKKSGADAVSAQGAGKPSSSATVKGDPNSSKTEQVRTRCDGRLRIITKNARLWCQLLAFTSSAPLLASGDEMLRRREGAEREAALSRDAEGNETERQRDAVRRGGERSASHDEEFDRWQGAARGDPKEGAQKQRDETSETEEIFFDSDVDDLRWVLQVSEAEVVFLPPGRAAAEDELDAKRKEQTTQVVTEADEEPVAVLPFEASSSGDVRLELFLASGRRCSRCWMRSPLVGSVCPSAAPAATASACASARASSSDGGRQTATGTGPAQRGDSASPLLCPRCSRAIRPNADTGDKEDA